MESITIFTIVIFIISLGVVYLSLRRYIRTNSKMYFFYFLGFLGFSLISLIQILFSINYYNILFEKLYIFLVAFLLLLIANGSILYYSKKLQYTFMIIAIVLSIIFLYFLIIASNFNIIMNGIAMNYSSPNLASVMGISSILELFASVVILGSAIYSFIKKKSKSIKLLATIFAILILIITGILGSLGYGYILYSGELIGMLGFIYGLY
ncbi:hypothetical protein MJ1_0632 [Nanobdella aerobiophila]|uniref:Multipass membrane protein n=1 Tax=Nanobdella aerobiophila TaxID=2586965 RepID=A0A915SG05_9ARCH|nr:hypothetical protein [Nanobdella aerobiophila]BBL45779.1 hypothetical protein MJ1_0632 [Nanobdella aerobiophila]